MGVDHPQELDRSSRQTAEVIRLAGAAMRYVTAALCDTDPPAPGSLPDAEWALRALRRELEDQALTIHATRAGPAVSDLRTIVVAAHVNAEAECIEDLARRLAEIARSRSSRPPVPAELQAIVCRMGQICAEAAAAAGDAVGSAETDAVAATDTANAEMSRLQHLLYRRLLTESGAVDVDAALDVTLASRYYVRCADHAASMAWHVTLLAGGSLR
jgi:phosphate transport system protein